MTSAVTAAPTTATLLISCPDRPGLVAKFASFLFSHGGNIIHADSHSDFESGLFLTRLEWQLSGFELDRAQIADVFGALAKPLGASWQLHFSDKKPRLSVWVSKQEHCLYDLLLRHKAGELPVEIPLIVSNHATLEPVAKQFGLAFAHLPITPETKEQREQEALALLKTHRVDLVVLAKYMQILSPRFLRAFPQVINIHHSFLPAFAGANPYGRAHERGVKVIGATAHYVTDDLDEGPIIEQDVIRVSHRDTVADLVREGKDIERVVLARAVRLHVARRVLVYGNRTAVFD